MSRITGLSLSPLEFAKLHSNISGGTLMGEEFVGQSLAELRKELDGLNAPSPVNPRDLIAANHRAGGVLRRDKLALIVAYLEANKLSTWSLAAPQNAFTARLEAEMARDDLKAGQPSPQLAEAVKTHAAALAAVDHAADFLATCIDEAEAAARALLTEADKAGVADKDMRNALQGDSVRLTVRKRFSDGSGTLRSAVNRIADSAVSRVHAAIAAKFKKKAA